MENTVKTSHRFAALPLAVAAILAGCGQDALPTSAGAPTNRALAPIDTAPAPSAERVHYSPVTNVFYGLGSIALPCKGCSGPGGLTGTQRFLFDVVIHKDGTLGGGVEYSADVDGGLSRTGTALCAANLGDGVWALGFKLTHSSGPDPVSSLGLPQPTATDDAFLIGIKDNHRLFHRTGPDEITGVIHTQTAVVQVICANPAHFGFTSATVEAAFLNNLKAGVIEIIPNQ